MNRNVWTIIFLWIIFISNGQANTQSIAQNEINNTIPVLMQKYHINGIAIALIDHGKKSIYVFGKTNQGSPITQKSIFQLGSITKTFTTLLLSEEIENKNIKLSDSVTDYLVDFSKNRYFKKMTLEQLATFTSGLPFNQPDCIATKKQLQDYLLHLKPSLENKNTWRYSNISIGLLGDALFANTAISSRKYEASFSVASFFA